MKAEIPRQNPGDPRAPAAIGEITQLLNQSSQGDERVLDRLVERLYADLRRAAERELRRERSGHSLTPTALVNEAFLRLESWNELGKNRNDFFRRVITTYRRVLVDHARKRRVRIEAEKSKLTINASGGGLPNQGRIDVLDLDSALGRLGQLDSIQAEVASMRLLSCATLQQIAEVLGLTADQAKYAWKLAKLWLSRELSK